MDSRLYLGEKDLDVLSGSRSIASNPHAFLSECSGSSSKEHLLPDGLCGNDSLRSHKVYESESGIVTLQNPFGDANADSMGTGPPHYLRERPLRA